jgi:hypothetical protein
MTGQAHTNYDFTIAKAKGTIKKSPLTQVA